MMTITWNVGVSGTYEFAAGGNWLGGIAPGTADLALFNGAPGPFTLLGSPTLAAMEVDQGRIVFPGGVSASGALSLTGGTLTLAGADSFAAATISGGTLAVENDAALGTAALGLTGGTLLAGNDVTIANGFILSGTAGFDFAAAHGAALTTGTGPAWAINAPAGVVAFGGGGNDGTVVWGSPAGSSITGTAPVVSVLSGTVRGGDGNFSLLIGSAPFLAISSGATLDLGGFDLSLGSLFDQGRIANSGPAATLTFSQGGDVPTIDGPLNIVSAGTATIAVPLFAGAVTVTGGVLTLAGDAPNVTDLAVNGGTLALAGNATNVSASTIAAFATLVVGSAGTGGALGGPITDDGVLVYSQSGAASPGGAIEGEGSVQLNGGGTLTLSLANAYSGDTTIGTGTVVAENSAAFGAGVVSIVAGTLVAGVDMTLNLGTVNVADIAVAHGVTLTVNFPNPLFDYLSGFTVGGGGNDGTVIWARGNEVDSVDLLSGVFRLALATGLFSGNFTSAAGTTFDADGVGVGLGGVNAGGLITNSGTAAFLGLISGTVGTVDGFFNVAAGGLGGTLAIAAPLFAGRFGVSDAEVTLAGDAPNVTGTTIGTTGTLVLGNGGTGGALAGPISDGGAMVFFRSGTADVSGLISGAGNVQQTGTGTLKLSAAANTYSGGTTIGSGSTVELAAATAAGFGDIVFAAPSGEATEALVIDGATPANLIAGFSARTGIDLRALPYAPDGRSVMYSDGHLTIAASPANVVLNFASLAASAGQFLLNPDGAGGTLLQLACFHAGTRILTSSGEREVERLRIGDLIPDLIARGLREVVWIGRRQVDCRRHPQPRDVWPVRIMPDAFGPGRPARSLLLSPDHAVFIGGELIPIRYLIAGDMIAQMPCDTVEYWHIELERHAVVLAENLPCETYLDTGNRAAFDGGLTALHPTFAERIREAGACAPLVIGGPKLRAVRAARRAAAITAASVSGPFVGGGVTRCGIGVSWGHAGLELTNALPWMPQRHAYGRAQKGEELLEAYG